MPAFLNFRLPETIPRIGDTAATPMPASLSSFGQLPTQYFQSPTGDESILQILYDETFIFISYQSDFQEPHAVTLDNTIDTGWLVYQWSGVSEWHYNNHEVASKLQQRQYQGAALQQGEHRFSVGAGPCQFFGIGIAGKSLELLGREFPSLHPIARRIDQNNTAKPYLPVCTITQKIEYLFDSLRQSRHKHLSLLFIFKRQAARLANQYHEQLLESASIPDKGNVALYHDAQRYIREHCLEEDISPKSVADAMNVSISTLNRAFANRHKQVLGYIKFFRLMKGRELLHLTDMPLKDIAYRTHYAEVKYFVKEYKNVFLIHPKYRADYLPGTMDEEE